MKCTLYATAICIFLASDLQAMDETEFPSLQTAYHRQHAPEAPEDEDMFVLIEHPNNWDSQEISEEDMPVLIERPNKWDSQFSLAARIKEANAFIKETPQPKNLDPKASTTQNENEDVEMLDTLKDDRQHQNYLGLCQSLYEDDETPYSFKNDRRHQYYINRRYQGSPVKARKNAERIAHILDKRADINPPRKKEAETPKPSEPSGQLVYNVQPQETIKKKYVRGNNTTHIEMPSKPQPAAPASFNPRSMLPVVIAMHISGNFK